MKKQSETNVPRNPLMPKNGSVILPLVATYEDSVIKENPTVHCSVRLGPTVFVLADLQGKRAETLLDAIYNYADPRAFINANGES